MRHVIALICFVALGVVAAQPDAWSVGVVVSATGPYADVGRLQAFAAERAATELARTGVFGVPLEIHVRDDASDPRRAVTLALELADAEAVAVVCCTTPAATAQVAAALDARSTPLLALADADLSGRRWSQALVPDDRTRLTAVAVDAAALGKVRLALMTLDTPFGDATAASLERALADAGRTLAGEARYPADAEVLTPEGLWIATREPGAVIVWGLPRDLPVALDGLRRRGYTGYVYARDLAMPTHAWPRLVLAGTGGDPPPSEAGDAWLGLRTAVAPAALAGRLPPDHPHAAAVAAFVGRVLGGDPGAASPADRATMARVDDALVWLLAAFEQVAALNLGDAVATRRQATYDALIAAPLVRLAAGAYDARDGDPRAARWQGLVIAAVGPPER